MFPENGKFRRFPTARYTTTEGAGPILGDTAVELHSLQVYESATNAEMEAIALEMAKEWVL